MHVYICNCIARGWGDPHITTIDGRRYTFNGLGEYVLLRTNNSNFEFQGRTELAPNSAATVFSAFALREGDDIVEVIIPMYIYNYVYIQIYFIICLNIAT